MELDKAFFAPPMSMMALVPPHSPALVLECAKVDAAVDPVDADPYKILLNFNALKQTFKPII